MEYAAIALDAWAGWYVAAFLESSYGVLTFGRSAEEAKQQFMVGLESALEYAQSEGQLEHFQASLSSHSQPLREALFEGKTSSYGSLRLSEFLFHNPSLPDYTIAFTRRP